LVFLVRASAQTGRRRVRVVGLGALCYASRRNREDVVSRRVAVRIILTFGFICLACAHWACAPRLDEQQVRTRLVDQLQLQNDRLHIQSITREPQPVASIDYGGAPAKLRFHFQDGVWVIDAVDRDGRWELADRALRELARELPARARALQMADVMPRYARTLKLLIGWSSLLSADCGPGLPSSQRALLDLHAIYHRTLFANKGGADLHNPDMFVRDAWWKMLHVTFSPTRVDVQSSGADGRVDTPDDMRLTYTRQHVREGINVCMPHFTLPAAAADELGRKDAPEPWNCEVLMAALKRSGQLELVR
jgi:hypothetical protein